MEQICKLKDRQGIYDIKPSDFNRMGTKQSKGEDLDDEIGDVNPTHLQEINLQFTRDLEKIEADTFWCLSKIIDDIQDNYTELQPGVHKIINKMKALVQ